MKYQMEELLPIVSELAQKYSGCESTSVTYEKAESLMQSVLFCINEYNNSCGNSPARRDISLREQYDTGVKLVYEKVENIRTIFNEISFRFEDFGVRCLYDTVQKGIPEFLKWYDIKFCPQNTILTLDYPLLTDCSSLTGADAVHKYIQAIQTEQSFLNAFDRNYVISVLEKYDPEYTDMIENVCGIVLANMIGHIAIKKPFQDTGLTCEEYIHLAEMFRKKSVYDIESDIKRLTKKIVCQFYESDTAILEYLYCETHNMAARIYTANQHGQLNRVFVL